MENTVEKKVDVAPGNEIKYPLEPMTSALNHICQGVD